MKEQTSQSSIIKITQSNQLTLSPSVKDVTMIVKLLEPLFLIFNFQSWLTEAATQRKNI